MKQKEAPVQSLSIFLHKEEIRTAAACLDDTTGLKHEVVRQGTKRIGDLYYRQNPAKPPRWLKLFRGTQVSDSVRLYNASNAAVLLVPAGRRMFSVCFGQGRHLLAPGSWEGSFGLRVTLNSVDPKRLRSLDRRTFDAYTSQTRTQTSVEGDVTAFGLNVERDLLRAATGQPLDGSLGRRMTGMDSLAVAVSGTLDKLPKLLSRFLTQFEDDSYKRTFPWVDHIAEVREPKERERLDDKVIALIARTGASSPKAWLAVPSLVDWARIDGFTYGASSKAERFPDLDIRDFLASLKSTSALTVEKLRQRKINAIDVEDGRLIESWPVYECIYAEIEEAGATCLLSGGKWYRVQRDFVTAINDDVSRLVSAKELPRYLDKSETAYNARIARSSKGKIALLDRKLVRVGGSTVETCDLYTSGREFIHVKRYGGSSVLSHLFAQGAVSATAFVQDREFRRAFNKLLPRSHRLTDPDPRPNPTQFEIVYAVVSNSDDPIDRALPFFSRLNLRNSARMLSGFGFAVRLAKIGA